MARRSSYKTIIATALTIAGMAVAIAACAGTSARNPQQGTSTQNPQQGTGREAEAVLPLRTGARDDRPVRVRVHVRIKTVGDLIVIRHGKPGSATYRVGGIVVFRGSHVRRTIRVPRDGTSVTLPAGSYRSWAVITAPRSLHVRKSLAHRSCAPSRLLKAVVGTDRVKLTRGRHEQINYLCEAY